MRRRRIEVFAKLRKARKDDQLMKRRNASIASDPTSPLQDCNALLPTSTTNIVAGDGSKTRDLVLGQGDMTGPLELIKPNTNEEFRSQEEAACAVTNLVTGDSEEQVLFLFNSGALPSMCEILSSQDWKTVTVILDGISHILEAAKKVGELDRVAIMIEECGGLDRLEQLQQHNQEQIYQKVGDIIDKYFSQWEEFRSQEEAACAVTNLVARGSVERVSFLIDCGALPAMCEVLSSQDWKTVTVILDGISHALEAAKKVGELDRVAIMIEECGGLDKLEQLQRHNQEQIYQKIGDIIDKYFS